MKIIKNILRKVLILKKYYRLIIYQGDKYTCPICNKSFKKFLPLGINQPVIKKYQIIGGGYRKNAVCPFCESTDRERFLYLFLKKKSKLFSQSHQIKLLHVAPEKALKQKIKQYSNINYIFADINPLSDEIKMDITNIHFPSCTFNIILCNHVLEHIINDTLAMKELFRVLKPNGFAILQAPLSPVLKNTYENPLITSPKDRLIHFGQKDHVRIYGMDYFNKLKSIGFKISIYKSNNVYEINKYSLNIKESIFICKKVNI